MPMRTYAAEQASILLSRLAFRVNRTMKLADAESVHDLRVTTRRFSQCLRVFDEFFPSRERKRIEQRLRRIRSMAAEVRNRDVALALLKQAGVPAKAALVARLAKERKQATEELGARLERLKRREFSKKWRKRLKL
jgi:CHAD domain-containing protein